MSKYKVGSNQYRTKPKEVNKLKCEMAILGFFIILASFNALNITFNPSQSDASDINTVKVSPKAVPAESVRVVEQVSTPAATLKPLTREEKLRSFLQEKNSPLARYADLIVRKADEYDISYTLVTSIAGKESSFETAGDTTDFNAWGIMTWDENRVRSIRKFSSWERSIDYVSHMLSANYRRNMNKAIQEKYCPSFECSDTWVLHVTNFQLEIDNPDLKKLN